MRAQLCSPLGVHRTRRANRQPISHLEFIPRKSQPGVDSHSSLPCSHLWYCGVVMSSEVTCPQAVSRESHRTTSRNKSKQTSRHDGSLKLEVPSCHRARTRPLTPQYAVRSVPNRKHVVTCPTLPPLPMRGKEEK